MLSDVEFWLSFRVTITPSPDTSVSPIKILFFFNSSSFSVDPTGKFILDNYGRYGVFHGVNVVNKEPPYIPTTDAFDVKHSVSAEDIKYMKHLGFNLVRLGVEWEAVEKKEGEYDDEYLKNVTKLIN